MLQSVRFYRDALAASETYRFPPDAPDPAFVTMQIGESTVGLSAANGTIPTTIVWMYAVDCDGAVEQFRSHGAVITAEPRNSTVGERVVRALDSSGHELVISATERQGPGVHCGGRDTPIRARWQRVRSLTLLRSRCAT